MTKKDVDLLRSIERVQNNGRGVSCVDAMIYYLECTFREDLCEEFRMENLKCAQTISYTEMDKMGQYPEIVFWVYTHMRSENEVIGDISGAYLRQALKTVLKNRYEPLTVARMALKNLEKGETRSALARLRVDLDKLDCKALYDLILKYGIV